MSNLSNTPGGGEPPDRYRNVGEQIQAFFDFAENNPDRAVPFFVNIWETQASLTTRALALQGLGVAAKHDRVKEAFADWEVLKDIAKEVKGKGEVSNDLTRWAAASALEAIGYSRQSLENLEGGGFTEPLDRIRREIRDRKLIEINRIPRLNSRGETTAEYERHLEFWIYGPADELLNDRDRSLNYQNLIGDVISKLHGRGVYLGLMSPNSIVQGAALRQAELIFKESAEIEEYLYGLLEEFLHNCDRETSLRIHAAEIINTAGDLSRRLKTLSKLLLEEKNTQLQEWALGKTQSLFKQSAENEKFLYQSLEEFLLNSSREILFRINAAEIINTATDLNRRLKTLSKLLLEERNTQLQEWTLGKTQSLFKQSAENEKFLYQPLEEFLLNSSHEILLRINAAEIINTSTDLNRRLKTLSKLLLENTELRNVAVRLLTPYKQELARVDRDANTILDTLAFNYSLHKPELQDLTIAQIEAHISSITKYKNDILSFFSAAIAAAESLAGRHRKSTSILKTFLQSHNNSCLSDIESWLQKLRTNIDDIYALRNKVDSNQRLLKKVVVEQGSQIIDLDSFISPKFLDLTRDIFNQLEGWNNADCQTKNQCQRLANELNSLKDKLKYTLLSQKENFKQITAVDFFMALLVLGIPIVLLVGYVVSYNMRIEMTSSILLIIFLVLLALPIFILISRNKQNQKIMYILNSLTNNWQE